MTEREPTGQQPAPLGPDDYVGENDPPRITARLPAIRQSRWDVFARFVERMRILHFFAVGLVGSVVWGAVASIWYTAQWVQAVQTHRTEVDHEIAVIKTSAAADHEDLSILRDQFDILRVQVVTIVDGVTEMRGLTRELAKQQGIAVSPMPHIEVPVMPRRRRRTERTQTP